MVWDALASAATVAAVIYTPFWRGAFATTTLAPTAALVATALALVPLVTLELVKRARGRRATALGGRVVSPKQARRLSVDEAKTGDRLDDSRDIEDAKDASAR